jgi:hypothetical protein
MACVKGEEQKVEAKRAIVAEENLGQNRPNSPQKNVNCRTEFPESGVTRASTAFSCARQDI